MALVPPLASAGGLSGTGAHDAGLAPPPTPHANTGRRLSKAIMRADSQDKESSKSWGTVTLRDGRGMHTEVRVVQNQEYEDANMLKVSWVWSWEGATHQVELRHGRRSGIRKVYVDRQLLERQRSLRNLLADAGSRHEFMVGSRRVEVAIVARGGAGFQYQLTIDGRAIEQNMVGPMAERPTDIGTRSIQLPKSAEGLGMTLRNNPHRTGVVVWTVEGGKSADAAGLPVGDVVLSVEAHQVDTIDHLLEYVRAARGAVHMELAGRGASRVVAVVKARDKPVGLALQLTSCGVGTLVSEVDPQGSAASSAMKAGDIILSIDGVVPASPKHAVQLFTQAEYVAAVVVIGHEPRRQLENRHRGGDPEVVI